MEPAPLSHDSGVPLVGVVMGSSSDWATMRHASELLSEFGIVHETRVVSAHRTPEAMYDYARSARDRGVRCIIAGAGGAAHLPGMLAASTTVPVLGVPVPSRHLQGLDSLYSIVQMPKGVPVATFAIGDAGAANVALFAVAMLADGDARVVVAARRLPCLLARAGGGDDAPAAVTRPIGPTGPTGPTGPILPPATIGVLGGGQLGRMFAIAARAMGYRMIALDPDADAPVRHVVDEHLVAPYDDPGALDDMAARCAVVTTEFENPPAAALERLAARTVVAPDPHAVAIAQDRRPRKRSSKGSGCPSGRTPPVTSDDDLHAAVAAVGLPAILKSARLGYDGKGQRRVDSVAEVAAAFAELGRVPCVLEALLPLELELSVVAARSLTGEFRAFPVAENAHADGILDLTVVPARVSAALADEAVTIAHRIAEALDYRGVFAVELFVVGGRLLVNELAPRPHNSGHWTLDACRTSQFEQQVRAVCGLPLGDTALDSPVAMLNVLGDAWAGGDAGLAGRARHPGHEAAPLRQAGASARPQDGPRQRARRHRRWRRRGGRTGAGQLVTRSASAPSVCAGPETMNVVRHVSRHFGSSPLILSGGPISATSSTIANGTAAIASALRPAR